MTDEPTIGMAHRSPVSEGPLAYEKPRVYKFGAFRDLARSDEAGDRIDILGRRRTVAFLGLLSPRSSKPNPTVKV